MSIVLGFVLVLVVVGAVATAFLFGFGLGRPDTGDLKALEARMVAEQAIHAMHEVTRQAFVAMAERAERWKRPS